MVRAVRAKGKGGRPPIREETKDIVVKLYNEDRLSCMQIARACNISKSSVFRIIAERRANEADGEEKAKT